MSTLEVNTIDSVSGTSNLTIGSSNSSQITLKSGATLTNFPDYTPAFRAFHNTTQDVANNTTTTLNFNSETFDSDGTYDTSTNRFTPAVAGKYVLFALVRPSDNNAYDYELEIRTSAENAIAKRVEENVDRTSNFVYTIADLSADEYAFVTMYQASGATRTLLAGTSTAYFGGFKIIGA
tara:strand:+ start:96 stop:632 length:537 start_codon:yes stop_codon:yes gene_type:complete